MLILLDGSLLLLDARFLGQQDIILLFLTLDLSGALFIFITELSDILIAVAHHFGIVV